MSDHDYDFKTRIGHYRGRGATGLMALIIIRVSALIGIATGSAVGYSVSPWLREIIRARLGY